MIKLLKSRKFLIWGGLALFIAIVLIFTLSGDKTPTFETIIASRGDLVQEVSITGKVKPAESVDLQFQNSGRIATINYKAGDNVASGAVIASLDSQDLQATVLEKEAAALSARADLDRTTKNYESLGNSAISSSLRIELDNAKSNLEQVKIKATSDLAAEYNDALNSMTEAMTEIDSSSIVARDIYTTYLQSLYSYAYIESLRLLSLSEKDAAKNIYPLISQPYTTAKPEDYGKIDSALQQLLKAAQTMLSALNNLQTEIQDNINLVSSSDGTRVSTAAAALSSDLSGLSSAIQSIASQKVTNAKNIADAQSQLASAQATFPTPEDIIQKQAALKQAEAAVLSARSQLRKSLIIAPFAGVIARIDAERGQTVSSTTSIISLISASGYQVEANITEVDISKVSVGNEAMLTLDAYGSDVVFRAHVSSIDPGETVVEGVTTYKTTFDFQEGQERSVRPNMTANIDIQTDKKENVISIPQRAVITRNGDKIVRIDNNGAIEERIVQVGLAGRGGYIEVISGISEGEKVITFIND